MNERAVRVSAVVCTRNRASSIGDAVGSLLACDHPSFEVVVIDQSTDDATVAALRAFGSDPRLRVVSTQTKGLGLARNVGLDCAVGRIVAFTDDDCVVPPDWLTVMERAFDVDESIGVVFCNVVAAAHDHDAGFIPDYVRHGDVLVRSFLRKLTARGIGAGLAVRRDEVLAMGGFDASLGAGARFSSCEDRDVAIRAIASGLAVYETAATAVVHAGFRTWQEGRELTERDWFGSGAAYSKIVSCRQWRALCVLGYEAFVIGLLKPFEPLLHFRRPQGLRRPLYFARGFLAGVRSPVDRRTMTFVVAGGITETQAVPQ